MMFLWFPLLFAIPLAILWNARSGSGVGCCGLVPVASPGPSGPDPMDIARRRLARGEITPAEFEEIRRAIG